MCDTSNALLRSLVIWDHTMLRQTATCQWPVGRPLHYSDRVKSMFRKCNVSETDLEELAADRELWSCTCITRLKSFKASSEQIANDRRARSHAAAVASPAGSVCPYCGRIYRLRSPPYIRFYNRTTDITSVQCHHWNWLTTTSKQALCLQLIACRNSEVN